MKNVIAIVNQKGGVGKTTSVLNLATALSFANKKILVIDIDPQGNATTGSGIEKNQLEYSIYDVLINDLPIKKAILNSACKFDILPANRELAGAEIELVNLKEREYRLYEALKNISSEYDLILIDCPPSLSLLTLNALSSTKYIIVPIQCEYYALEGLTDLLQTIKSIQARLNPELKLLGILRTMYDRRNNLAKQVSVQLVEYFADMVFHVTIPRTVRLAEAPSYGMSSLAIDLQSAGAIAYTRMARELLKRLK